MAFFYEVYQTEIYIFGFMKKLPAILLASLVFFQSLNITLDDFVQLDELIEHARFHNKEYGDSFFVFLSKHYGEQKLEHSSKHQEEKEDHEKLPFQQQIQPLTVTDFLITVYKTELTTIPFSEKKKANFYYQESAYSSHTLRLFQPPKFS